MKLTKTLFISALILAVCVGIFFFLPAIVGAANTGGDVIVKCLLMFITSGGLAGVVVFFYFLATRKERLSASELKEQNTKLKARAKQLEKDLGGENATVSVKVEGVAIDDSIDETSTPKQNEDPSAINWTVKSQKTKANNNPQSAIVETINQSNKATLFTIKIIATCFILFMAGVSFLGAILPVATFEKIKFGTSYEINSICDVMGYYIHETDYSKIRESSSIYHRKYSYETNKKTDKIIDSYEKYLTNEGFVYNGSTKAYTLTKTTDYTYNYSVRFYKKANILTIKYTYEIL